MNAAVAFLDRFRRADREGDPLSTLVDDSDGFGAATADMPAALRDAMDAAGSDRYGAPALLDDDCFASAACDRHGAILVAGDRFGDWFGGIDPFGAAVRNIQADRPSVSLLADDRNGRPVALAAGTVAVARQWPLDPLVRAALGKSGASYAIVAFRPGPFAWLRSAKACGLTHAEALLVAALARHGDLQRASAERGVAYETGRKFVASAMRKTGSRRQAELIRRTLMPAAGDVAASHSLAPIIRDLFGLTGRQAELALLVAHGATRDGAAAMLGTSDHRAKADLKTIFQACGVASAVDLARIVAEIEALKGLATACEVVVERTSESLRLIPRSSAEGRIAVADHGPAGHEPVIVMHSNVSGRHHPRSFIAALQSAGFRPIAVERAGYGLSDPLPGDPVVNAVCDLDDVMDALGLASAAIVARCTTASVVACAAESQGRISGGVLLWPDAPSRSCAGRTRMTDRARAIFSRYPDLALSFARVACHRTGAARIEKLWRSSAAGVPVDEALLDDPDERADVVRGAQQAAIGLHGFVSEALALGTGPQPRRIPDATRWTAIFGSGYESYDTTDAAAFWGAALPGGTIRVVPDGVHFLHVTHVADVIEALHRATSSQKIGDLPFESPPS